jgi:hypothetical protein
MLDDFAQAGPLTAIAGFRHSRGGLTCLGVPQSSRSPRSRRSEPIKGQETTMQTPTVRETRRAGQKPRTTRALVMQSLVLGVRADQPKNGMGA